MLTLEEYLSDKIFIDYFNAFLSLPIFSTRFIYRPRQKTFEVDSSFSRLPQIDKTILCAWITAERIPFFWKTDLFLDYLLCKLLITKVEQDGRKEVSQMVDAPTVRRHIGNLIGMQQFRRYTKDTIGHHILNFWYDAERFRRYATTELRRFAFREIQQKYLKNGSANELPETIKCSILGEGTRELGGKIMKRNDVSIFSEDIFVAAQHMIVKHLCGYWVPKYILHKRREIATTYQQRRASRAIVIKQLQEMNPKLVVTDTIRGGLAMQGIPAAAAARPSPVHEVLDENDELEHEQNEFFEENRVSSASSFESGRKSSGRKNSSFENGENGDTSSLFESGRKSYPYESGRKSSPFESGRKSSPFESGRKSSTFESGRKSNSLENFCKGNSLENGGLSSPFENGRKSTPFETGRTSSLFGSGRNSVTFEDEKKSRQCEKNDSPLATERKSILGSGRKSGTGGNRKMSDSASGRKSGSGNRKKGSSGNGKKSCSDNQRKSDGCERNGQKNNSFFPDIRRSSNVQQTACSPPAEPEESHGNGNVKLPTLKANGNGPSVKMVDEKSFAEKVQETRFSRQFSIKESMQPSTPFAMLNHDMKTKKLKKRTENVNLLYDRETVMEAVSKASPTHIARVIKPTYYEDIPRTPLCPYQSVSPNSTRKLSLYDGDKLFLASITADRLAGSPFKDYLISTSETKYLTYLRFWEDAQIYIGMAQCAEVDTKFRQGRNIRRTYLQPGLGHQIDVDPSTREQLGHLLKKGQANSLLSRIGNHFLHLLHEPWMRFMADDDERFLGVLEIQKVKKVVPGEVYEAEERAIPKTQHDTSFRMYRALDLALGLVQQDGEMPDIDEDEPVSDCEDEEHAEEGSLRQGQLPILNKEAAVVLALCGYGEEVDYHNTRRNSHFYGRINRKPRKSSLFNSSAFKTRPPKPRKFSEALSDTVQLLWLKRFLVENCAIVPLKFWLDVEKMKTQSKDSRARQNKTRSIVKAYFANTNDPGTNLQCKADIIKEIPRIDYVTPAMLVSAQSCVIRSLEENWFAKYQATFPEDAEEEVAKFAPRNNFMAITKMASSGKTRGLWSVFIHCIASFVREVKKPDSCAKFIEFLDAEAHAPADARKNVNSQRKIINNRVISVERLVTDLKFWMEVQRFKAICDGASGCALAGNYTVDDEILIQSKARTIFQCYIDSELPPKIQINIPQEMADNVHQLWTSGCVERSLFYTTEVYVFCSLLHYWKKYSARKEQSHEAKATDKKSEKKVKKKPKVEPKKPEKEVLYLGNMPYKRIAIGPEEDPNPRLSYSLAFGLKMASIQPEPKIV